MSDLTSDPMTIENMRELLRTVMADVVTSNQVRPLVEAAVDHAMTLRVEGINRGISAIDAAQRSAYADFKETANQFRETLQRFTDLANSLSIKVGTVETRQDDDRKRISDLVRRVEHVETESATATTSLRNEVAQMKEQLGDLKADIHGDKENTTRPSVFSLLDKLDKKMDTISGVQAQQAEYINKRRGIESAIFNLGTKAVSSSSLRYILKWGLLFGTGGGGLALLARALVFISTGQ